MNELKQIVADLEEELEGAEHYAHLAHEYKMSNPAISGKYAEMSRQEMMHAHELHQMLIGMNTHLDDKMSSIKKILNM